MLSRLVVPFSVLPTHLHPSQEPSVVTLPLMLEYVFHLSRRDMPKTPVHIIFKADLCVAQCLPRLRQRRKRSEGDCSLVQGGRGCLLEVSSTRLGLREVERRCINTSGALVLNARDKNLLVTNEFSRSQFLLVTCLCVPIMASFGYSLHS
jgi:hypothetical protein